MRIIELLELTGKKARVTLDDCPFHPSGGGQPGDMGTLAGDGFLADVKDAHKAKGPGGGGVVLDLLLREGIPLAGMDVTAEVDKARNFALSRMHTAEHIFTRLQENACDGLEIVKVNIAVEESAIYIRWDGELTWDGLFETEEKTVEAIRADAPVDVLVMSRGEAEKLPELKAKWGRIQDEEIRVVRIAGVGATACAGTHVSRTGEIGGFMVTGFNGSAPDWEVRFTVNQTERLLDYSKVMRRLTRDIGCGASQVEGVFARQRDENAELRQIIDRAREFISLPWELRQAGEHKLYLAVVPGLTKELLSIPARRKAEAHPDAFCLVLAPGAANESFPFILLRGAALTANMSALLKKCPELEARGGGKPDWLNGAAKQRNPEIWLSCISGIPKGQVP